MATKLTKQIGDQCTKCKRTNVSFYKGASSCQSCCMEAKRSVVRQIGDRCPCCKRTDVRFAPMQYRCVDCAYQTSRRSLLKRKHDPERSQGLDSTIKNTCACGKPKWRQSPACRVCAADRRFAKFDIINNAKVCGRCERRLDVDNFYPRPEARGGLSAECKECLASRTRSRMQTRGGWNAYLTRTYGITSDQWDAMYDAQGSACAACSAPIKRRIFQNEKWIGSGDIPHVDHCHDTGVVRGLLCPLCNRTVTSLSSPRQLRGCADYLERWQS